MHKAALRTTTASVISLALLGLAACATASGPSKEDMLTAAGFRMKLADTPEKLASLNTLPAHRFLHKQAKSTVLTLYADPSGCKCLYVGDAAAWQAYEKEALANHLAEEQQAAADEQSQAAMMNNDAAMMSNVPWGPWGVETWGWGPW